MSGKYALIIGNTEYTDPGLAQLKAPGKDADDFARVLSDREICAFDEVNKIINEPSISVIEAIEEFFDQKKPDDLLVVYFSGHGIRDEFGNLFLAFKNTIRSRLRSTAIKSDYLREAMDQSRSKRQVLILDCCNSGAFPQGTKAEVGGAMGMVSAFQGYGRFVLTASDATQFAWEGNQVIGETQNSLFTHFLLQGLKGEADSDGDGKITVDELYDYAYEQISKVTPKQTPTKSTSKQEGEIVLRQISRVEDIRPVPLPGPLLESIENPFADIRLGAVQGLNKLLNGKNLGLARSAREALQRIAEEDDSNRVKLSARQALESISLTEGLPAQKAREDSSRITKERFGQAVEKKATTEPQTQTPKTIENKTNLQVEQEEAAHNKRAEAIRAAREREQRERQQQLQQKHSTGAQAGAKTQGQQPSQQTILKTILVLGGVGFILVLCTIFGLVYLPPIISPTSPVIDPPVINTTTFTPFPTITFEPFTQIFTPTDMAFTPTDMATPTLISTSTNTYTPIPTSTATSTATPSPTPTSQLNAYAGTWLNIDNSPTSNKVTYALTRLIISKKNETDATLEAYACINSKENKLTSQPVGVSIVNGQLTWGPYTLSATNTRWSMSIKPSGSFLVAVVVEVGKPTPETFQLRKSTIRDGTFVSFTCSPPVFQVP